METQSKHRQIFEQLKQQIMSGAFREGGRLPSEHDLVELYKASRPTISRALRDLQLAGLIERKVGSGTYIKEQSSNSQRLFGLLIPELGETEIFEPICGQIAQEAQNRQYSLLWGNFNSVDPAIKRQQVLKVCEDYIKRKVAGVFFAPLEGSTNKDPINQQIADALCKVGIAIVLLDRDLFPFPARSQFDLVGIDNRRSAFVLTQHLLSEGRKRIAFLARPNSAPTVELRISGYREALFAAKMSCDAEAVQYGDPEDHKFLKQWLLKGKHDAVVCANDATAASLMHTLEKIGLSIIEDVRVVGFDDVRYARLLRVPLTTVRQPCREIGSVAVQTLLERIQNPTMAPREILLEAQIVIRQSSSNCP